MSRRALARSWFLPGLALSTLLALLLPELGERGGPLRPETTTRIAIAAIFLLHGLAIEPAALRAGALNWRLHAVVQLFIFAGFPVAVLALDAVAGRALPAELRIGFLFLAILPTTIVSGVVYTATAGGSTTAALFNAAFANIAGVLITPLWAAAVLHARGDLPPAPAVIANVAVLLLLPFAAGQLLRPLVARAWLPPPSVVTALSNGLVLFIVFTALAGSIATGAFADTPLRVVLAVAAAATALFLLASAAAAALGSAMRFPRPDRIALAFVAPQKTLAAGAPMAHILFAGHATLGVILLPLIIYHAVQLVGGAAFIRHGTRSATDLRHDEGQPPQRIQHGDQVLPRDDIRLQERG